ncbi:unnamed protein product [Hermetia illucens]|uniref:Zeta-sarcoglycan n=1 Tax=Hermetia illucens TaxID=343691 RepID=A0A7R8V0D3_HERIL|nr:unnamed protein product [Hermetia illucens]
MKQSHGVGLVSWIYSENSVEKLLRENDLHSYADDHSSSEGLILLSNPNVYQSSGERQPSLAIMNSSSASVNTNHHHQQQQLQHPSISNNNTNSLGHKKNNNAGTSPGSHRHDTTMTSSALGGASMSTGISSQRQAVIGHTTGADPSSEIHGFHLSLHGWRKKCLYVLILGLMILIIVNLVLTLWILKVMEFSSEGMGQLKIVAGGIQLSGQALILDILRASTIRSRHGQPISIESSRNFSINTRDANGLVENHLFLGHDRLECLTKGFRINDSHGGNLFSVNRNEVVIGAHTLKVDGEGGAIFRESIQTTHVRADAGRELKLESPTRQLEITASQDINLQSRAGNIEVDALKEIKFSSSSGSIRFDSPHILLPNLKTAQAPSPVFALATTAPCADDSKRTQSQPLSGTGRHTEITAIVVTTIYGCEFFDHSSRS